MNCDFYKKTSQFKAGRSFLIVSEGFVKLKPTLSLESGMNDKTTVLEATSSYLDHNSEINRQIMEAPDARSRKMLLQQKNQLIEEFEVGLELCDVRPDPAPDLPVFDIQAMDHLLSKEAELDIIAGPGRPKVNLIKTISFSTAIALFMFSLGLGSIHLLDYAKTMQPVISEQEEHRTQVEQMLAEIGDTQTIESSDDINELKEKLGLIRKAIAAIAAGGTDETLEELVNQRREAIRSQLIKLTKQQNS